MAGGGGGEQHFKQFNLSFITQQEWLKAGKLQALTLFVVALDGHRVSIWFWRCAGRNRRPCTVLQISRWILGVFLCTNTAESNASATAVTHLKNQRKEAVSSLQEPKSWVDKKCINPKKKRHNRLQKRKMKPNARGLWLPMALMQIHVHVAITNQWCRIWYQIFRHVVFLPYPFS